MDGMRTIQLASLALVAALCAAGARAQAAESPRKLVARARTVYLVCQVKLVVGDDYRIKTITAVVDKPGRDGAKEEGQCPFAAGFGWASMKVGTAAL